MHILKMLALAGGLFLGTSAHANIISVPGDSSAIQAAMVKDFNNHDSVLDVNSFAEWVRRGPQACGCFCSETRFERS